MKGEGAHARKGKLSLYADEEKRTDSSRQPLTRSMAGRGSPPKDQQAPDRNSPILPVSARAREVGIDAEWETDVRQVFQCESQKQPVAFRAAIVAHRQP